MFHTWNKAIIIGFGEAPKFPPKIEENTLVICADGGVKWAKYWGIVPNVIIGDFDSQKIDHLPWPDQDIEIHAYSPDKDKTDLELAVHYCINKNIRDFILVGVWGKRIDHSLGNLEILYQLGQQNISCRILASDSEIILVGKKCYLSLDVNTTVSLIPLTPIVEGVTTMGLYYSLDKAVLRKGKTLGISNFSVNSHVLITTTSGILIAVIEYKK